MSPPDRIRTGVGRSNTNMLRNLSFGVTGPDVAALQAALNAIGSSRLDPLKVDGIFGSRTLARVREFQSQVGLKADGIVGPMTRAKIEAALGSDGLGEFRQIWDYAYRLLVSELKAGPAALLFFERQRGRLERRMAPPVALAVAGRPGGQPPVLAATGVLIGVGVVLLLAAFVLACLIVLARQSNAPAPDIAKLEREFEQKMAELDRQLSTAPIKIVLLIALMVQTIESIVKQRIAALEQQMEKCKQQQNQNLGKCKDKMDKIIQQINHIKRQLTNLPFDTPAQRRLTLMGLAKSFGFLMILISDWGRCMGCQSVIFF